MQSHNFKFSALERQRTIFINGLSGKKPRIPVDHKTLEAAARKKMSKQAYHYATGGAGIEQTILNNRSGFGKWQIVPRVLKDVSQFDLTTSLFENTLPAPLLLAPVGVLELVHRKADIAVAKAASSLGIPMIFSNQASCSMEDCSTVMGDGPRWFQLYWSKSNDLVRNFVKRAELAGCSAIVVTLDTTMLGWRTRDLDLAYLPFLSGRGIAQYISDPVFQSLLQEPDDDDTIKPGFSLTLLQSIILLMHNYPGSFLHNLRTKLPLKAVRKFINIYTNPSLNWEDLAFLREHTKLPILLKGILHPDDGLKAVDHGADGIIVSNHGGRQVDGAISAIEALPEIVKSVNNQIPVLMDSGIRTGADMFKAIALGAKAICLGRPYVYGLAINGANGVRDVIQNLLADFELTMRLAGCRSIEEIDGDCLRYVGA